MTRRPLASLAPLLFLLGCPVTGDSYPQTYANELCSAMFLCVADENDIEFWTQYDDEEECAEGVRSDIESSTVYDQYEEGDRTFDKDVADTCLREITGTRDDSDCGGMSFLEFLADSEATGYCAEAFPEADE